MNIFYITRKIPFFVISVYELACGILYHMGFWSLFHINILSYMPIYQVIVSAIVVIGAIGVIVNLTTIMNIFTTDKSISLLISLAIIAPPIFSFAFGVSKARQIIENRGYISAHYSNDGGESKYLGYVGDSEFFLTMDNRIVRIVPHSEVKALDLVWHNR